MSIENLKKLLESEREIEAEKKSAYYEDVELKDLPADIPQYAFQCVCYGHEAATNRLLPLLQKAVEMAEFVDLNTSLCPEHRRNQDIPFCSYNDCDIKIKAREFLSEFTKMTEIKKESV